MIRGKKNTPKESCLSSSFNPRNLKAKYSSGQRINQFNTDGYLKGKHTFFHTASNLYSGFSV